MADRAVTEREVRYCEVGDCFRKAVRNGRCATHRKRQQRNGIALTAPIKERQSPYEVALSAGVDHLDAIERRAAPTARELHAEAVEAFRRHLDAEADADYHRTRVRFRKAARVWTVNLRTYSLRELFEELDRITSEIQNRGRHVRVVRLRCRRS